VPQVVADAPKVVWALDFQFDSTIDGEAIKIASMVDEHTRESLLDLVERSITADRLVDELEVVFAAAGGPPMVLRMDNGPELISQALQQFCDGKVGLSYIPPGTPWNNGYIESFNNRLRKECLNRNHWTNLLEARVVIGDFKHEHNQRHRHSALGYLTRPSTLPDAGTPTTRWPAKSTESGSKQPGSKTGWTQYRGLASADRTARHRRDMWSTAPGHGHRSSQHEQR
jgi:putative transposase